MKGYRSWWDNQITRLSLVLGVVGVGVGAAVVRTPAGAMIGGAAGLFAVPILIGAVLLIFAIDGFIDGEDD